MLSFKNDPDLAALIDVAEQAGEKVTGRVFGERECVDVFVHPGSKVLLTKLPVLIDETITCTIDSEDVGYDTCTTSGVLRGSWPSGVLTVTYTAGYAIQPATDVQGVLEMVRHLWETQRGTLARINDDGYAPGSTFSIPRRVAELWGLNVSAGFA